MKKHFRPTLWWMIHTTLDCVLPTQFSVIQTIHWNVGLSVFFFNFTKVFVIIVIYAYLIDISQGSVETHLQRGGICTNHIIANCLQSVPVKEFWKSVNNWRRCGQKYSGTFFVSPCVSITALFTFVVAIFGCCLERFTFKFQNGNSVHSFETNLKTYFFTRTSFSHSLAAFQISYITWIWCCINYIDYLLMFAGYKIQLHAGREVGARWTDRDGKEHTERDVSPRAFVDSWHLLLYLQTASRLHALLSVRATTQSRKTPQRSSQKV